MSRAVLQTFELYQKARVQFVQTIAELAERPQNIEALLSAGVMDLLRPLLLDNVPGIRQSAALALGKLASYSEEYADAVVSSEILGHLVKSLSEPNRFYKKAAAFVLRAVAKHSPTLAKYVVDAKALEPLGDCLKEFDPSVKESAAAAIRAIAKHSSELAQTVVDNKIVEKLILCIQEPEIPLKRVAVSALGEICKHSPQLANCGVGAVPFLSILINHPDAQLIREVFLCLSNIARHKEDQHLAEEVAESGLFPRIYKCLKHPDILVRKYACTCIREIAKQNIALAKYTTEENGGVKHLVEYITEVKGSASLPGIHTLGFISSFDESLAMSVISAGGIPPLKEALLNSQEDSVKETAAWALGQIGCHTNDHARAMTESDTPAITILLKIYTSPVSPDPDKDQKKKDVKKAAKKALKNILLNCSHLSALEPLISESPPEILQHILFQFSKNLQNDNPTKKSFVLSGGLRKILELKSTPGSDSKLKQYIEEIISQYPPEIIQFHSPDYKDTLMKKLEDFNNGEGNG